MDGRREGNGYRLFLTLKSRTINWLLNNANWILTGIICLAVAFNILLFVCLYRNSKKIPDENKNKMDGDLLGRGDLSEEEACVFYSELPSLDSYKSLN